MLVGLIVWMSFARSLVAVPAPSPTLACFTCPKRNTQVALTSKTAKFHPWIILHESQLPLINIFYRLFLFTINSTFRRQFSCLPEACFTYFSILAFCALKIDIMNCLRVAVGTWKRCRVIEIFFSGLNLNRSVNWKVDWLDFKAF